LTVADGLLTLGNVEISGKTAVYGIIGQPVTHSLSPVFQARFLAQVGVDAVYVPFAVQEGEVASAVQGLYQSHVQGLNVTVPHKETVLPLVHGDGHAQRIGAVNTLVRGEEGWHGHNTDWQGIAALLQAFRIELQGATVLMFGAGGTARAVLHALAGLGVGRLGICNRGAERAGELLAHAESHYNEMHCELVAWDQQAVASYSEQSSVAINVTSIGLGAADHFPFVLSGKGSAVDVVYRPDGDTVFCRMAAAHGWQVSDGLPMLIAQGAEAFALWHRCERPDMLDALRWMERRLGRRSMPVPGWEAG